jgi:Cupin-like domain
MLAAPQGMGSMTAKMTCFDDRFAPTGLDREPFLFGHTLLGHPALSVENLARVIPSLPKSHVYHSNGRLTEGDNLDSAHLDHAPEASLEATMEDLRNTDAYIMVRQPEQHASFQPLHAELKSDVDQFIRKAGLGGVAEDTMLYLFIASPNSVTPFHIDRYSTFLMQFRGSKEVTVFPPWDNRVVEDEDTEQFFANTGRRPPWRPEAAALGTSFGFSPGQTLHIPFTAGHHVRNGPDDVSISLSIIFNTEQTRQLIRAMLFNHHSRRLLRRVGLQPRRVAMDAGGVGAKAGVWTAGRRVAGLFRGSRG